MLDWLNILGNERQFNLSIRISDAIVKGKMTPQRVSGAFPCVFPLCCLGHQEESLAEAARPALTCRTPASGALACNNHGTGRQQWRTSPASCAFLFTQSSSPTFFAVQFPSLALHIDHTLHNGRFRPKRPQEHSPEEPKRCRLPLSASNTHNTSEEGWVKRCIRS